MSHRETETVPDGGTSEEKGACPRNFLRLFRIAIALQSMYAIVKARVRAGGELTDVFLCPRGLKQGEVCSPVVVFFFFFVVY